MNRVETLRKLATKWNSRAVALAQETGAIPISVSVPIDLFPAPFDLLKKRIQSEQLKVCARALEDELGRALQTSQATLKDLVELGAKTDDRLSEVQDKYLQFRYLAPEDIEWLIQRAEQTFVPTPEQESTFMKQIQRERERASVAEKKSTKYRAALEYARGALVRHREKPVYYTWETTVRELWSVIDQGLGGA